ncbi:Fe-S oxidoreductase [Saxibacter everestensis]|uniref:Fe-S oxidoreductase n=1 Tax=Saxibacter everestensis TaxID=2909229 RepID=A0ABY8QRF5_9MICO|nr:Fe-S oxidoreductase [Brevibacteriaceae bacterium ZFBP1038]
MSPERRADWSLEADMRVARGHKLDAHIPQVFLDSPISHTGAALATILGFVWGLTLGRGKVTHEKGLWIFTRMPGWAFGRGGICIGSCYFTRSTVSPAVLGHERVHREQWRRYGLLFPLLYALAGRDPLRNRFEIEAGLKAGGYAR